MLVKFKLIIKVTLLLGIIEFRERERKESWEINI